MKVQSAMHKGVEWVGPDTPVTELAKLMRQHDVGSIPIGEDDRLIGREVPATSSAKGWRRTASMLAARRRAM